MAVANVKRYIVKDAEGRNYKHAFDVPVGKVFILSGAWTNADNTVYLKIITVEGEEVFLADSLDETNRSFRGMVLDSQDSVYVKLKDSSAKGDIVIAGELFDKA